jgi:hypothetical protein
MIIKIKIKNLKYKISIKFRKNIIKKGKKYFFRKYLNKIVVINHKI